MPLVDDEPNGIRATLSAEPALDPPTGIEWGDRSMRQMVTHLEHEHHQILRGIIFHSAMLLHDAGSLDSAEGIARVRHAFRELSDTLILHIEKEEHLFFPMLVALESARERGKPSPSAAGGVRGNVAAYVAEHGVIYSSLARLCAESASLAPATYRAISGLQDSLTMLERRGREYLDFENHVVFPRAVALEDDLQRSPGPLSPVGS